MKKDSFSGRLDVPADAITLTGMRFYGYHGCLPEERQQGQTFLVDLSLRLSLAAAGQTDDLRQSVDYAQVFALVRGVVEGEPVQLIETVAERIAQAVLEAFPQLFSVEVTVHKPDAPIPGSFGDVAVHIVRQAHGGEGA